jgi:hypothetical protein
MVQQHEASQNSHSYGATKRGANEFEQQWHVPI